MGRPTLLPSDHRTITVSSFSRVTVGLDGGIITVKSNAYYILKTYNFHRNLKFRSEHNKFVLL